MSQTDAAPGIVRRTGEGSTGVSAVPPSFSVYTSESSVSGSRYRGLGTEIAEEKSFFAIDKGKEMCYTFAEEKLTLAET